MQMTYGAAVAAGLMAVGLALAPAAQATNGGVPSCATLGNPCGGNRVVFVFDLSKKFFNLQPCTCEKAVLTVCDPNVTVSPGESAASGASRVPACVSSDGVLTEVPTQVEGVKNPGTFFCTTIGGRRTCYNAP